MKRFLFVVFFIFLIGVIGFFVFQNKELFFQEIIISGPAEMQKPVLNISESGKETPVIRIFAVGDIMLDRGVEYMIDKYGKGDYKFPFLNIADDLKGADILFGNLESVISDRGIKVGSIYSFRADPKAIDGLVYAGFNILSVANNHIFDYGREAMGDSFERLKSAGIEYAGGGFSKEEACSPIIKEISDPSTSSPHQSSLRSDGTGQAGQVKIAFLAYTNKGSAYWAAGEDQSGICWLDKAVVENIKNAKKDVDILIVSMHWGEEYQPQPNQEQKYWAYLAIDAGADLIIGHHPHVAQPLEQYNGGWIAYSLGNFVFDQGFSGQTMKGLLLEVLIKGSRIEQVNSREIKLNDFFQPEIKETL